MQSHHIGNRVKMAHATKPGSLEKEDENVINEAAGINAESVDLNLLSMENLDRNSPELWEYSKDQDIQDFTRKYSSASEMKALYSTELTEEDKLQIEFLKTLSKEKLLLKVKELHDLAYQLGVEEAREMIRAKYLNIFNQDVSNE